MARRKSKLKSGAAARDPHRAALAVVLGNVAEAEEDLRQATEALDLAKRRVWQAEEVLEAARDAEAAAVDPEAFIASVAAGRPLEVRDLGGARKRSEVEAAERAVVAWRQTQEACQDAIAAKQQAVTSARFRIDEARKEVAHNAIPVADLLDGIEDLRGELINRLAALSILAWNRGVPVADAERVAALLSDYTSPYPTKSFRPAGWEQIPAVAAINRFIDALGSDPDAPPPTMADLRGAAHAR